MRGQWKKNEVGKYNYNTESRLYVFVLEYRYITKKNTSAQMLCQIKSFKIVYIISYLYIVYINLHALVVYLFDNVI